MPIVLFGYSWGGYSVCSVLTYHPEVKAVIACSGFNSSSDMFEAEGKRQAGDGTYVDEFNAELNKWIETLDYDYTAAENKERFSEDKADYIHNNLDRDKWCNMLNSELFEDFIDFYDKNLN